MGIGSYFRDVLDFAEKHAGLGGWVGAIGAIAAVFVTWGIARAEYLRNKREEVARRNADIDLIENIVDVFDLDVVGAHYYYPGEVRPPDYGQMSNMEDLAGMSVILWPNLQTCGYFKVYWRDSLEILKLPKSSCRDKEEMERRMKRHRVRLKNFKESLQHARYWGRVNPYR